MKPYLRIPLICLSLAIYPISLLGTNGAQHMDDEFHSFSSDDGVPNDEIPAAPEGRENEDEHQDPCYCSTRQKILWSTFFCAAALISFTYGVYSMEENSKSYTTTRRTTHRPQPLTMARETSAESTMYSFPSLAPTFNDTLPILVPVAPKMKEE